MHTVTFTQAADGPSETNRKCCRVKWCQARSRNEKIIRYWSNLNSCEHTESQNGSYLLQVNYTSEAGSTVDTCVIIHSTARHNFPIYSYFTAQQQFLFLFFFLPLYRFVVLVQNANILPKMLPQWRRQALCPLFGDIFPFLFYMFIWSLPLPQVLLWTMASGTRWSSTPDVVVSASQWTKRSEAALRPATPSLSQQRVASTLEVRAESERQKYFGREFSFWFSSCLCLGK